MTKLFAVERQIRKTVFTSIWKFYGIKNLKDLTLFACVASSIAAVVYMTVKHWIG